jgi:DNA-directed DNA polymerase III PolC
MADSGADFVHLHVHSQYSFLDGAIRVKDLVKRAKEMGAPAVALTDHGNMFGAITFYKTCKEAGIKGILGCELNVLHNDKKDARKDPNSGHGKHLVALAKNEEGYKNLIHLVSMGYVDGKSSDGVPRIDVDLLSQHSKGLIGLSGCMGGGVAQAILEQGEDEGRRVAAKMKDIFDPGAFYLEVQDHGFPEQPILNGILRQYCQELDLPRVATNDAHYPKREDASAHLHLCCIGAGKSIESMKEGDHGSQEIFLKSPKEMLQTFRDDPVALKNTLAITEQIELKLKLGIPMLPTFQVPEGSTIDDHFKHVSREGLERRFKEFEKIGKSVDQAGYRQRLEWELDVICKMKFPGYFLIVWDFIRYAKEHGIPVGPGRGSGAGSIVAYALRITDLDPLPYNLLFERFLNPERVSMPDFDIDFCMDRRQNVIEYVAEKYGMTSVGQIATFAELKAKSVIKDVGRVMGVSPAETQRLSNLIPMKGPGQTYSIPESLEREPKLKALADTDPRIKELLEQATKLEGLTRQAGMHAAGVVISEGPLWDHVPCFTGANGELVTQYYKDDVELAGLVKFDFLGLKTLTVLDIAVRLINERPDVKREGKTFILDAIPMDDELTFKLLQSGECKGVFQLESSGMQSLFKDLKPTSFEDIVAAVALYRPGPLGTGMVKDFVDCRHGRKPIQSLHPLVDELLKPTYGVIVYQEQVMQIAQLLAGYSLGGADLLRRAMGKKKPEEMAKQKSIFVDGCIKNNVREEDGVRIFELLEYFAGYGFNKCVVGSTTIVDATTGERTTVKDLFHHRRDFTVHSLNEKSGKLGRRAVTDVVWNGRKPVFELRTAQGKRIVATDNHPFHTLDGWRNLGELRVGDAVAGADEVAARRVAGSDVVAFEYQLVWDRVVAIEPRGVEDTFDLTVDVDHNFVADGLIVHNSHSAAYGLITYQTAYLKAHYPVEFMCASMSADKEKIDKVVRLIAEGRAMGVTILSPDINESGIDFSVVYETPEGDARTRPPFGYTGAGKVRDPLRPRIRFGLGAVRGIGEAAIQAILEVRQSGPFRDMFDFAARVDAKRINKGVFEALVHSGSLDSVLKPLAVSRASAAASVELALERSKAATKDRNAGQSDMFGLFAAASTQSAAAISGDRYVDAAPWDSRELLLFEKKSLGFYLSGHPLDRYGRLNVINTSDVGDQQERSKVKLAGMVEGYRERPMKTGGGKMAFFELEDRMGRIEVKVRPQQVETFASVLSSGEPIVLKGMMAYDRRNQDSEDDENTAEPTPQILLDEAQLLSDFIRTETRGVSLRIAHERARTEQLHKLAELFRTCRGGCPVTLTLALDDGTEVSLALGPEFRVEASDPMLAGLERLFGDRVAELRTA